MFFTLMAVTFGISALVAWLSVTLFKRPLAEIFERIIKDPISVAWQKYVVFATYVVGVSGGVRIYQLERYITAPHHDAEIITLSAERWVLELYRTVIETLQSIAWMYLIVFIFALVAYVIVKGFEFKYRSYEAPKPTPEKKD